MKRRIADPETIMITGASSGIGEALARHYARTGRTLLLTGRNAERLNGVATSCRTLGAVVETSLTDVTDRNAMRALVATWHDRMPIDLLVANAGISGRTSLSADGVELDSEQVRDIFAVNLAGVLNTVEPAIEPMSDRGGGQIAIMSSLAGFRGIPSAPAYGASKAAVRSWGEGLRGQLAPRNIAVNVICPGFVESRITDENDFAMPFLMEADKAAEVIARGLARNRGRIAFPWPMYMAVWLFSALPVSWTEAVASALPRKG